MNYSNITHSIKHRKYANDEFMTPPELAQSLVKLLPDLSGLSVLEPCAGKGAFARALPTPIVIDGDFYEYKDKVDWIVTNPPYSDLDKWLQHSFELASEGIALLLGLLNITPHRIEMANKMGFGLTQIHLCKVFHWFGISTFVVFEYGKVNIVSYDRIVWR